jgi:hypothetical protein
LTEIIVEQDRELLQRRLHDVASEVELLEPELRHLIERIKPTRQRLHAILTKSGEDSRVAKLLELLNAVPEDIGSAVDSCRAVRDAIGKTSL